jgi:hypothetical protein
MFCINGIFNKKKKNVQNVDYLNKFFEGMRNNIIARLINPDKLWNLYQVIFVLPFKNIEHISSIKEKGNY